MLDSPGLDVASADRTAAGLLRANDLDHALRIGAPGVRHGFLPAPGGPVVTWRSVCSKAMPTLSNWRVGMGDVELF